MYNTSCIFVLIAFPFTFLTMTFTVLIPSAIIILLFAAWITELIELISVNRFLWLVICLDAQESTIYGLLIPLAFLLSFLTAIRLDSWSYSSDDSSESS